MHKVNKIFIIGLPRTGTTSICATMLNWGYSVAHTAYTQVTFDQAIVLADTPIFYDYARLDQYYPNSQFIYLTRNSIQWLPSIRQLLQRMYHNVVSVEGGFNPVVKRCYQSVFAPFTKENIAQDAFLLACYQQHQAGIFRYFHHRRQDLLVIDISHEHSYQVLQKFLALPPSAGNFAKMNSGGKITAWKDIQHSNKIASTKQGKVNIPNYFVHSQ